MSQPSCNLLLKNIKEKENVARNIMPFDISDLSVLTCARLSFVYFLLDIDPCMPCCLVSGPRLVKSNRFAAHNSSGICCSSILHHSSNIFSARRRSAWKLMNVWFYLILSNFNLHLYGPVSGDVIYITASY
jgi:hypothetical protein